MENNQKYSYPDRGDVLTDALIQTKSKYEYWDMSEVNVLSYAKEQLKSMGGGLRMMDLGCGMGRLLPVFSPLVKTLEGFEPDRERFSFAVKVAEDLENVTVRQGDCNDAEGMYDAVLCSHVFQHIPRASVEGIFCRLAEITSPGALLVVTTTHVDGSEDKFTCETFTEGVRISTEITPEEFDAENTAGKLPVRFFAVPTMERLASAHGFELTANYGYHFSLPAEELTIENDIARNSAGDIRDARDIMYLLRRKQTV